MDSKTVRSMSNDELNKFVDRDIDQESKVMVKKEIDRRYKRYARRGVKNVATITKKKHRR